MLQPGGIMVVTLHYGHANYDSHLERIRRSFKDAVLVIDDGEMSNSIVVACNGHALEQVRPGAMRRPKNLDPTAANQLLAGGNETSLFA
jgi:spermidine synthase